MRLQPFHVEKSVGPALALLLQRPHPRHHLSDVGAALAARGMAEDGVFAGHGEVQVNAVEQGAGKFVAVALDLFGAAPAAAARIPQVAARAGVHRGNQLETRGKTGLVARSGNDDLA